MIVPGLSKIPASAEYMFWLAYIHKDECSCLSCLQRPQGRNNPNVYRSGVQVVMRLLDLILCSLGISCHTLYGRNDALMIFIDSIQNRLQR